MHKALNASHTHKIHFSTYSLYNAWPWLGSHLPKPDLSSLATPASKTRPTLGHETKTLSNAATFGGASRAMEFGHNRSHSLTIGNNCIWNKNHIYLALIGALHLKF